MSIFDQLREKIVATSGTQAAPEQGRHAYLDRLEQSEAEITQRISGLFAELGKAYYESYADDGQMEYAAQLAAIRDAYAEIAQLQKEADEVAAHKRCPACGAQLADSSRFCNICGTKLPEIHDDAEPSIPERKLCPKCQAEINPDDVLCVACGADLRDTAVNGGHEDVLSEMRKATAGRS